MVVVIVVVVVVIVVVVNRVVSGLLAEEGEVHVCLSSVYLWVGIFAGIVSLFFRLQGHLKTQQMRHRVEISFSISISTKEIMNRKWL